MIRVLADDLTGALDTAAAFDGEVPVVFDRPAAALAGAPVAAVATPTRDVDPAALPALLAPSLDWLAGAGLAFKKVDSLLRGNTFAELRLAAQAGGWDELLLAPAFPRQGRLTVGGRLCGVDGHPRDPAAPTLADALGDVGCPVRVPDVRSDADLQALVRDALAPGAPRRLWCGSAGLAHALAAALGRPAPVPQAPAGAGAAPLLLVSASHQAVTRRQFARLRAARPDALAVEGGDDAALAAALAAMRAPFRAAFIGLAPATMIAPAEAAARLERRLAAIAAGAPRPGVLVVVGGDTLLGLCRATGAQGLRASAATRAGWGQARWLGGRWDGLACHSRSGAFGDDADLVDAVAALQPA